MSFAAILLICVIVTAIMAIADRLYFEKSKFKGMWLGKLFEQGRSFLPVFLLVFFLRSFLVEPFRIPSSSLEPTLLVGDFLLVNKYTYGVRFPVFDKKLINTEFGLIIKQLKKAELIKHFGVSVYYLYTYLH